jgi:phospholipid-transporting ATPase
MYFFLMHSFLEIVVTSNKENYPNKTNKIKTSKYSLITFLPKNLYVQFSKLANIYFLIIGIMQMITTISITDGKPVIFGPLTIVIGVSMLKDAFEVFPILI